ncbi:MAG TPA: antibiotic biosynthesis monooxygenase [Sulfurimonas autotrophica]|nr:antibiotic biosynthesis monooxygenase [Sulfurimonas autotrophica]
MKKVYAVIFRAKTNKLDDKYFTMAKRMRELAINEYGCLEFTAVTEGSSEIAISYWESMEQITLWKQNSEHLIAQKLGQSMWYEDYTVEIMEVISKYTKDKL